MCDTLCIVRRHGTLFAKNSDRPVGERQLIETFPRRPAGGELRTTHIAIEDAGAFALVGSRPAWCWGLEHGVNEHRVAIGNEKIWTVDDPRLAPAALVGMDLVRLGLERARSADEAIEVITGLLERHGQGGDCEEGAEPYWSSFLVADPAGAWVLETSARTWVARAVDDGAAISNRVTLSTDWDRASRDVPAGASFDDWRDPSIPTEIGDRRLAVTRAAVVTGGSTAAREDLTGVLRDHGGPRWGAVGASRPVVPPPPSLERDFTGITVCMHLHDYQVTAAAMIAELPAEAGAPLRAWACLGSPCVGVFVPIFPPLGIPGLLTSPATWDRFDRLRRRVEEHPQRLAGIRAVLDPLEADLWAEADALGGDIPTPFHASIDARLDGALRRLAA